MSDVSAVLFPETRKRRAASGNGSFGKPHGFEHSVDAERKLVLVKFGKKLRFHDIENYVGLLRATPEFRATFSEIVDLRNVEELELQAEEFLRLADEIDPFAVAAKRSFVTRTAVQAHAARMHKILRGPRRIGSFSTVEDAERWIQS